MSQFFAACGQSIGVSASASVLPMNIQDSFPLGLTGAKAETPVLWPPAPSSPSTQAASTGHSVLGETAGWPWSGRWADPKASERGHLGLSLATVRERGLSSPCRGTAIPGFAVSHVESAC